MLLIAWPASSIPADRFALGSSDRPMSSACIRSISAVWSFVMSEVNSNSTASYAEPGSSSSSSTMRTAPSWCAIISVRNKRSKAVPSAAASSAICSGVAMPAIVCVVCMAWCAVGSGTGSPRDRSQSCMNLISSSCDALMRPATSISSCRLVRSPTSAAISMAW